jgi:hypothetical protein
MKRFSERASGSLLLILIGIQGCFLPVPFNETGSPPLVGIVLRSDGGPAAGRRIAVTTGYNGPACSEVEASATTDSAGRFELPRTLIRYRGIVLVPPFESAGMNSFTLCGGERGEAALRAVYRGFVALALDAPPQTVSCFEWSWQSQEQMACTGARETSRAAEGGRWSVAGRTGRYRVVLTEELAPAPGSDRPVARPRAYVLWIAENAAGLPLGAVETVQMPLDDNVTELSSVQLLERGGRFYANLRGYKRARGSNYRPAELEFELGPPGKVTKVAGP